MTTAQDKPVITIVHQLPGRLRLLLSHVPGDPDLMVHRVRRHEGIDSVEFNAISRAMLVRFNPLEVSQAEIVVRVACSLSLDYNRTPVRVLARAEIRDLNDSAFYSGLAVLVAFGARQVVLNATTRLYINWVTGLVTAASVLSHGWQDMSRRGYFDPEVLSVVYLVTAMLRGRFLAPALVTWLTTFGRHLFRPGARGVEIRIAGDPGGSDSDDRFSVLVSPDRYDGSVTKFLRFIPAMVQYAVIGGAGPDETGLLGAIRDVAGVHDQVLDGLGGMEYGIPIRVRSL